MELLSTLGTPQVKVIFGMGLVTSQIGKKSPIAVKLLTLYGEGGPSIGLSQT